MLHNEQIQGLDSLSKGLSRRSFLVAAASAIELLLNGCSNNTAPQPSQTTVTSPNSLPSPTATPDSSAGEARVASCDTSDWSGITSAISPELRVLAGYEHEFGGKLPDGVMTFTTDDGGYAMRAIDIANETVQNCMSPLVIMEPNPDSTGLSLAEYVQAHSTPEGQEQLRRFFTDLSSRVNPETYAGMYVYAPETNIPAFGPVLGPEEFARYVVASIQTQKSIFPNSRGVVLFDSTTYRPGNTDWSGPNRSATALNPYATALRAEAKKQGVKIDVLGLQGYPWSKTAEPKDYLPAEMAINAARAAGITEVVLSTGTASQTIDPDTGKVFRTSLQQREKQLTGVLKEAKKVQTAGLQVSIVLFAEDKATEEANWAYQTPEERALLRNFVEQTRRAGLGIIFFAGG